MANGLDALHLVLRAYGIGPGDEVIVPANTYIATWLAVSHVGAVPLPVEPQTHGYNIDPQLLERAISPRTRAIIPVHLYGTPADMEAINAIAGRHGLKVIEDAAQAHGAMYGARRAGALGDAAGFSFYPGKTWVRSAMAALSPRMTMPSPMFARAAQLRLSHEVPQRSAGLRSRLDELQAAFLRAKLPLLDGDNARRAEIAQRYLVGLRDAGNVVLPVTPVGARSVWHLFVIRHQDRDGLAKRLAMSAIGSMIHYPVAPHLQPAYRSWASGRAAHPLCEALHEQVLSLPIGPHLSDKQVDEVVRVVANVMTCGEASFPPAEPGCIQR